MAECRTSFDSSVLEGLVKIREKKKWKQRWCVLRRLSPVADSLTLNVFKEKNGQKRVMKLSVNLEGLFALESGFLLEKESQTLAVLCKNVSVIFSFDSRETLLHWQAQIIDIIGKSEKFDVQILSCPPRSKFVTGQATLHLRDWQFSLTNGIPPRLLGTWSLSDLRRYGAVDEKRFCFEGGTRCTGGGEGFFCIATAVPGDLNVKFDLASNGRLESSWLRSSITSPSGVQSPLTRHRLSIGSRSTAMASKPNTPLLNAHSRNRSMKTEDNLEPCLSPPCVRHLRPCSQQHSRTSSVSSEKDGRLSSFQKSDPVLLYDKPKSLNVTVASVYLEHSSLAGSRPNSSAPEAHYDTPRKLQVALKDAADSSHLYEEAACVISRVTETSSAKNNSADYLLMQPGTVQPSEPVNSIGDYVAMQPLPCFRLGPWTSPPIRAGKTEKSHYQNPCSLRSLTPSRTLPRQREASVSLRLRRSASMPCRQGNRDSSDSTDSGVSVTADVQFGVYANGTHPIHRHWSLPRPAAQSSSNRLQPWPNTILCQKTVRTVPAGKSCHRRGSSSNSSDVSQLLEQLDAVSVNSLSYETCV